MCVKYVHRFLTTSLKCIKDISLCKVYCSTHCKTVDVAKSISLEKTEVCKKDFKIDLKDIRISDSGITSADYKKYFSDENKSVLEPCKEDVSHFVPNVSPTFNFAPYVNKSFTLQEFVKIGVKLHLLEKKKEVFEFVIKLDFENDVKNHLRYV